MTPILRTAILLLAAAGMLGFHGCETLPQRPPKIKNGKTYGITRGSFRYRWWNYYERARSFADGGFWKDAELDLRAAIRQREADQRMARTYGMHFIDYFPHAELGVSLYHLGVAQESTDNLTEAVAELERSMAEVNSAKAAHYLDLARRALLDMKARTPSASSGPDIAILSPETSDPTNALSIAIRGRATDADFVRSIRVGDIPVRIDVSGREIPFEARVPLQNGLNRIPVRATNLRDKTAQTLVTVQVDRVGPIIDVDGGISDPSGLVDVSVDGVSVPVSGETADLGAALPAGGAPRTVEVRAEDRAGNVTVAALAWPPAIAEAPVVPLYAEKTGVAADWRPGPTASRRMAAARKDVRLELKNPQTERVTYLDKAVIDGAVYSGEDAVVLTVLGEGNENLLNIEASRHTYHFSCLVPLTEGENFFNVRAVTPSRKSDELTLRIHRKIPSVQKPEARLKLLISPFELDKTLDVEVPLSVGFEDRLMDALSAHEPARFARVADMETQSDPAVAADRAKAYAEENGYHYLLFGRIEERKNSEGRHSLIVQSRFEDLEGHLVVPNRDTEVYGEDLDKDNSPDKLKALSAHMSVKLIDELPIIEGQVTDKKNEWIGIDIGKDQRAKPGLDLIVYKLLEEPIPGFGNETEALGIAKIQRALPDKSLAKIYGGEKPEAVAPKHHVITR